MEIGKVDMGWFNYIGVIIFGLIMIPNIVYFIKHKDSFNNTNINKSIIILEQIARYGCIAFLIFNIPMTYYDFWLSNAKLIYIIVNCIFLSIYLLAWMIHWKSSIVRAAILSIMPSLIFIFCGVMIISIPLIVLSIIFSVIHIYISIKNAKKLNIVSN